MINTTPAKAIAEQIAAGLGLTLGTNLFVGLMPEDPPVAVCVYDQPGGGGVFAQQTSGDVIRVGVQVCVRDIEYIGGYSTMSRIRDLIRGSGQRTVINTYSGSGQSGYPTQWVFGPAVPQGGVIPLGWDHRRRHSFHQSFNLYYQ